MKLAKTLRAVGGAIRVVWTWVQTREPVATGEAVRQVLLLLVILDVVDLTEDQLAGVVMAVSSTVSFLTRSAVTSAATLEEEYEEKE